MYFKGNFLKIKFFLCVQDINIIFCFYFEIFKSENKVLGKNIFVVNDFINMVDGVNWYLLNK